MATQEERTQELNAQQRADNSPSTWQYNCEWCGCDTEGGSDYRECECCRDLPIVSDCAECGPLHMNEPSVVRRADMWASNHAPRDYPEALTVYPHAEMES